jgi:hypothetical protein
LKIIKELRDYCAENQIEDIAQLVGSLKFEEEL